MGGRLDAVNILDADVALVTNVDLDHIAWLGADREAIGYEKAGIYRRGRPAIFNDTQLPQRLCDHANDIGATLLMLGQDYGYESRGADWTFHSDRGQHMALPMPALRGEFQLKNAAGVLMAVESLRQRLPVNPAQVRQGLLSAQVAGRMQVIPGPCEQILDVAHNPHAAVVLARTLRSHPVAGRTIAVVAMLADKDMQGVMHELCDVVDVWMVAGLDVPRGARCLALTSALNAACGDVHAQGHESVAAAYAAARQMATSNDRVLVFGSFYTVAEVLSEHV